MTGADHEALSNNHCYFQPQLTEWTGAGESCAAEIKFFFIDDMGEEYSWMYTPGRTMPVIALPKNRCYDAWITDIGVNEGEANCGRFDFDIITDNKSDEPCFKTSEEVEERGDVIILEKPEYKFCLDSECNCPDVAEP